MTTLNTFKLLPIAGSYIFMLVTNSRNSWKELKDTVLLDELCP